MSTTTLTYRGRLPGVAVDPALPAVEQPVRLDVAGFVGFAERGPLDEPVVVEDPSQFAAVFGGDLPLASDGGTPVWAQLPTVVRAFFDNGGRRCWVVRVAGSQARAGTWTVPGLQLWEPGSATTREVVLEAAWPGAWSQGLSVAATLLSTQLARAGAYQPRVGDSYGVLPAAARALVDLQPGDLIRVDLASGGGLFARVHAVEPSDDPAAGRVLVSTELRFRPNGRPSVAALGTTPLRVSAARLLRLELSVSRGRDGRIQEAERWSDLAFGPSESGTAARPCWTDVLQTGSTPDLSRSRLLRAESSTVDLLAGHVLVPVDSQAGAARDAGDDDLETFPISAFTDQRLAATTVFSLLPEADRLTSLAHDPQPGERLRGLHALLGVGEVAVVAVPDAGHRSWTRPPRPAQDPVPEPPQVVLPTKDPASFGCCDTSETPPETVAEPVAPPPEPTALDGLPLLDPVDGFDDGALVDVQVALVTMCAARADQLAILSVPRHYDVGTTLTWRERLRADPRLAGTTGTPTPALGYAGLWHPWVSVPTGTSDGVAVIRDVPPDGTAAGCIAARELERGPWLAPAGTPLRGLLRTVPTLSRAEQASLFDAHANLVTHPPGGFVLLSAHTLADDRALLQVSVRRLLIWIRKTALRLGERYVFEVNDEHFRELVQLRFDRLLRRLLDLGAVAAYRVVVDPSPEDHDDGRLVVQLHVAPTSPVEFITVTLTRTGEGLLDVLEV